MYQRGTKRLAPSWYRDHDYHDGYANMDQSGRCKEGTGQASRNESGDHGFKFRYWQKDFFLVKSLLKCTIFFLWNLYIKLGINCPEMLQMHPALKKNL